jgi:hypothetical protein
MMHLPLAVDVKYSDFEWEPAPERKMQVVQPPPAAPTLFLPELFASDIVEWSKRYVESRLPDPVFWEEQERKREERATRDRSRLARIAERKLRKQAA